MSLFENVIAKIWNDLIREAPKDGLRLGFALKDGALSKRRVGLPHHLRTEHIAVLGKTGTGKSSLLKQLMAQDISESRGFICIDLHGDLIPFVLSVLAESERTKASDLSSHLLYINPNDPKYAVGLNLIECQDSRSTAVQISEMVAVLKARWKLDHFGARTEELLRNCLWVLCENHLTLLEIAPLLTDSTYRVGLLKKVINPEVRAFFESRYDRASEAMQAVMREAVLNKVTAFTVDPSIRHIIGQQRSAVNLEYALDHRFWILLDLRKGSLGENALTFAGLFLARLRNAVFARTKRDTFSLYADELPNLVSVDEQFSTLLSEGRKFGLSVVSTNQFLNQLSPAMKSVLLSVGTILSFALSPEDAPIVARALGGEQSLIRRLKMLPHRHVIARTGELPIELVVPEVKRPQADYSDLRERAITRFAKPREQIEAEINERRAITKRANLLDDWE